MKLIQHPVLLFSILFSYLSAGSQIVYTNPEIPIADAFVTVYFNAQGTPLAGYTGDVYTHTGVTVNGNKWQYVIGTWGINSTQPKLTSLGNNLYKLDLSPTIRNFYGVPASGVITELCFVFRSADSGTQTSPDIFIPVFSNDLSIVILEPSNDRLLKQLNEPIQVSAVSPLADSMFLFINNELKVSVGDINLSYNFPADHFGTYWVDHWVKIVAENTSGMVADSFSYVVIPTPSVVSLPAGMQDGINYLDGSTVILSLYAPQKEFAFAVGDFNGWQWNEQGFMNRTPDNLRYWIKLENLVPAQEYAYQYFVDGEIYIGDPYCEKVLDPWNDQYISNSTYPNLKPYPSGLAQGIVSVFQTNQTPYIWQNETFDPPAVTDLVIYELLIRDFIATHKYSTLTDTLSYLKRLGVNAIELMPVNEFEGNLSWGYNPNYYFAPDKYYGPKNTLKAFIDACHGQGIAVILDVVYNHSFGTSPYVKLYWDDANGRPAENSPFYNPVPKHDFNVGFDINHESNSTKAYISRAFKFWLDEYKVDGFRLDLSKGFTQKNTLGNPGAMAQYDQSRINILKQYADVCWSVNPETYVILEHFADNSEEKVLSDYGMLLWGNLNYNYNEATMGWTANSNFDWISYKKRGWNDPHVVGYMESHDEERLMAKNLHYGNFSGSYNVKDTTTALKRIELAAAFFFTIPGPKMIWQFGELGYDYWINYPGVIGEGDHRTDQKPIKWNYQNDYRRKVLYGVFSSLAHLKQAETFRTTNYNLNLSGALKSIQLNHSAMNVNVLGNFGVTAGNINPTFQHSGIWYDYFAGDSINVVNVNSEISLNPGEYRIYTDIKLARPEIGLDVEQQVVQGKTNLHIYPVPSSGEINLSFSLSEPAQVEVNIFNISGLLIKPLYSGMMPQGSHDLKWSHAVDDGNLLSSGIYFAELVINGSKEVAKIVIK